MKFVVQRVTEAEVKIDGASRGRIGKGFLVLIGIGRNDDRRIADKMVDKLCRLRIFEDENGKTNLSLRDVQGALLLISQFTLYADCRHGNRPGFTDAEKPEEASRLYDYVIEKAKTYCGQVERGVFGADMKVTLLNDGPFTVILDSDALM